MASSASPKVSSEKVRVYVRIRPMNQREAGTSLAVEVSEKDQQTVVVKAPKGSVKFKFDHCFWSVDPKSKIFASQEAVYVRAGQALMDNVFDGYNSTLFAYGQTGSGKTHTMLGNPDSAKDAGAIPRILDQLFKRSQELVSSSLSKDSGGNRTTVSVTASYLEIYMEKCRDLLDHRAAASNLRIREHPTEGPFVEGLTTQPVRSRQEAMALLDKGNSIRATAATNMNEHSSRSHAILSLVVTQTTLVGTGSSARAKSRRSKVHLVDLAGSENINQSGAQGVRQQEASKINLSLLNLGRVIEKLSGKAAGAAGPVPYRDSSLTFLLKDSLGGNAKTAMIATASPSALNVEQTVSTLRYASSAANITTNAVINEDAALRAIKELEAMVSDLKGQLTSQGGGGADAGELALREKQLQEMQDRRALEEKEFEQRLKEQDLELAKEVKVRERLEKELANINKELEARHKLHEDHQRQLADAAAEMDRLAEELQKQRQAADAHGRRADKLADKLAIVNEEHSQYDSSVAGHVGEYIERCERMEKRMQQQQQNHAGELTAQLMQHQEELEQLQHKLSNESRRARAEEATSREYLLRVQSLEQKISELESDSDHKDQIISRQAQEIQRLNALLVNEELVSGGVSPVGSMVRPR